MSLSCLRVLVADSQPVFRAGVIRTLCAQDGIDAVAEAETADALIDGIRQFSPDVAVVDGYILDRTAVVRLDDACAAAGTHVLVVAPPWNARFVSLLAGGMVTNCILRASGRDEFVTALRKVGAGERFVHDAIDGYRRECTPDNLTVGELSVLALAAEGLSNVAIADELRVSPSYINSQVRRLLQKLNARDRTHAVTLGIKHGLLDV